MINPCQDCVFCGKLAERDQSYCGMEDDPTAALKACVAAYMYGQCNDKMTRRDVQEMRQKVVALELKLDRDRAALLKTEQLIHDAMEVISEMRSEVVTPSTADAVPLPREGGIGGQIDGPTV